MSGGGRGKKLCVREAARVTGLEESRIRYFEHVFPDFFQDPAQPFAATAFNEQQVAILRDLAALWPRFPNNLPALRTELLHRHAAPSRALRVITVTSGKGGVGKTTVSLNLSLALAGQGARVLLFDADLGLANVHVLAGLQPRKTIVDYVQGQASLEELILPGPGGLQVICGGSGIRGLADLSPDLVQKLGRELRALGRRADVVVLDTAAGLAASVLQFVHMADEVVVVATPNLASTLDAYGMIKVAHQERAPGRVNLLVNQAENEAQAVQVQQKIGACAQQFLGFRPHLLGYLERDPRVEQSAQARVPYVLAHPQSDNARRLQEVAAHVYTTTNHPHRAAVAPVVPALAAASS